MLDCVASAVTSTLNDSDFSTQLQRIKQHFYHREYTSIFSEPFYLPIYTANYAPGRALCYYHVFKHRVIAQVLNHANGVLCLGAGSGSELVALLATYSSTKLKEPPHPIFIYTQDIADWTSVLNALELACRQRWQLKTEKLTCTFSQGDLLECDAKLCELFASVELITAFFVMNELFTSKAQAMRVVEALITHMRPGAFFLMVDSAGSFSNLKVGGHTYMVWMIFDALKQHFEPVLAEESEWYRYPKHLVYPLSLNNMRYFVRMYRKL